MIEEWKKELTNTEKELLNFIYLYWKERYHWPENNIIRIKLRDVFTNEVNLNSIGTSQNSLNGYFINYYEQSGVTSLTPLGIALCDNSKRDIDLFLKVVRFFSRKYNEDYENYKSVIYIKNFPRNYFNSDVEIKNFCNLFFRETPQLFKFTGCNFTLDNQIINLEKVNTIDEYYTKIYNNRIPPRFQQNSSEPKRIVLNFPKIKKSSLNFSYAILTLVISGLILYHIFHVP